MAEKWSRTLVELYYYYFARSAKLISALSHLLEEEEKLNLIFRSFWPGHFVFFGYNNDGKTLGIRRSIDPPSVFSHGWLLFLKKRAREETRNWFSSPPASTFSPSFPPRPKICLPPSPETNEASAIPKETGQIIIKSLIREICPSLSLLLSCLSYFDPLTKALFFRESAILSWKAFLYYYSLVLLLRLDPQPSNYGHLKWVFWELFVF